ncbi:MAG: hypothetical protein MUC88_09175 [Planctomycetes bacterium]|nr:hypothetical protein [Planctomycetota bacterium]
MAWEKGHGHETHETRAYLDDRVGDSDGTASGGGRDAVGADSGPVLYDYLPPAGYGYACPAIPEIIGRAGVILGAIDSRQDRSQLAEQRRQCSEQVIAKDLEYRQRWLNLQREQASQQQQVEQYRLEVARLQMQVEELRARNAQLERENLQSQSRLGPGPGEPLSAPAPRAPAPQ